MFELKWIGTAGTSTWDRGVSDVLKKRLTRNASMYLNKLKSPVRKYSRLKSKSTPAKKAVNNPASKNLLLNGWVKSDRLAVRLPEITKERRNNTMPRRKKCVVVVFI